MAEDDDQKPKQSLSGRQLELISEAILEGFSEGELSRALRYKWGLKLANYVNLKVPYVEVADGLVAWTERRGKTLELGRLLYAERPGNDAVRAMAKSFGLTLEEVRDKYDVTKPPQPKASLEAMVNRHSRFVDYSRFLARYESLGDRICKITTPTAAGTGFLVGRDLVLTNFHVVQDVKSDTAAREMRCVFDFRMPPDRAAGAPVPAPAAECGVAAEWCVASSPYSESDLTGVGEAGDDCLDYALVRLADNLGEAKAPSGNKRGWFELDQRPVLAPKDPVVVPQHARGRALEVAWGSVLAFNGAGTRVRYDATTDLGSSGSPCFTADLLPFGLHQASDPNHHPEFNQAIPLDLIAGDLKARKAF